MALLKEEERICRELGNINNLAISLINQALVLSQQKRHHDALEEAEEAYELASDHGYVALAQQILSILEQVRSRG